MHFIVIKYLVTYDELQSHLHHLKFVFLNKTDPSGLSLPNRTIENIF